MGTDTSERRNAREKLLDAASRLFYAHGVAGTGIDSIIAEAGVAKMSLYNNFRGKDDLVRAYIAARHEEWLELYRRRRLQADSATEAVLAVFDAYVDHAEATYKNGFRGCGLLNAAGELPVGSPGRQAVRSHKDEVERILATSLAAAGVTLPDRKAEHMSFLLEGAMSRAGLEGDSKRLLAARQIAADMLEVA